MTAKLLRRPAAWPWPLPAVLAWLLAGAAWVAMRRAQWPDGAAWAVAVGVSLSAAACLPAGAGAWRRSLVALGFPLAAASVHAPVPAWAWLAAGVALLVIYPLRAWRDAPWFPTPRSALAGLDAVLPGPPPNRILDAGCGLGDGLRALSGNWPGASLDGVEWSLPLAWAARLRCRVGGPRATVRRGDLWADDWSGYDLVYVFQRPESMARVWAKASSELRPGAWLASLEFEVPGVRATAALRLPGRRPVWIYAAPGLPAARAARSIARVPGR